MADEVTGSGATEVDAAVLDGDVLVDDAAEDPKDVVFDGVGVAADGVVERCVPRVRVRLSDGEVLGRPEAVLGKCDGDFVGSERVGVACVEVGAGGGCCGAG